MNKLQKETISQRETILLIGEGVTEVYYLYSLRDDKKYRPVLQNISPGYPKNSSLKDLEKAIEEGICKDYDKIFCLIDMDNKTTGKDREKYLKLKNKYHNQTIKRMGNNCLIRFYETERCTELFFLYYFKYTSHCYSQSKDIVKELYKECKYEKNQKFFKKHPLNLCFVDSGGCLDDAIKNANKSLTEREKDGRNYTYSELGKLFDDLGVK